VFVEVPALRHGNLVDGKLGHSPTKADKKFTPAGAHEVDNLVARHDDGEPFTFETSVNSIGNDLLEVGTLALGNGVLFLNFGPCDALRELGDGNAAVGRRVIENRHVVSIAPAGGHGAIRVMRRDG
jgi:hypothetical protein